MCACVSPVRVYVCWQLNLVNRTLIWPNVREANVLNYAGVSPQAATGPKGETVNDT